MQFLFFGGMTEFRSGASAKVRFLTPTNALGSVIYRIVPRATLREEPKQSPGREGI